MTRERKTRSQLKDLQAKPTAKAQTEETKGGFLGSIIKKAAPVLRRVARVS
jgi:hypothetical protein